MKLNATYFNQKWFVRFADNDDFLISEKDLRELAQDIADSFVSLAVDAQLVNVPLLDLLRTNYPAGYQVKWPIAGQFRLFSVKEGVGGGPFPAPTNQNGDANFDPVALPTSPTVLSLAYDLAYTQHVILPQGGPTSGVVYSLRGPWNNGPATQVVEVAAAPSGFALTGTLVANGVRTSVQVDVAAGTALPAGQPLTAATTAITFLRNATLPTVSSGTFTADPTGAVAGTVVFIWLGPGASRPDLSNPVFQLEPSAKYVTGKTHRYAFCVGGNGLIQYNITPF